MSEDNKKNARKSLLAVANTLATASGYPSGTHLLFDTVSEQVVRISKNLGSDPFSLFLGTVADILSISRVAAGVETTSVKKEESACNGTPKSGQEDPRNLKPPSPEHISIRQLEQKLGIRVGQITYWLDASNQFLRKYLNLPDGQRGVVIWLSPSQATLLSQLKDYWNQHQDRKIPVSTMVRNFMLNRPAEE